MRYIHLILTLYLILFLADSCTRSSKHKAVYEYFKNDKDSLKLRAAEVLIRNISDEDFYLDTKTDYEPAFKYADSLYRKAGLAHDVATERFIKYRDDNGTMQASPGIVFDKDTIRDLYLIKNIESAYQSWVRSPWREQITLNDFCETILPYRVYNEQLINWRDLVRQDFKSQLDTINSFKSSLDAAKYMGDKVRKQWKFSYPMGYVRNNLDYEFLSNYKMGICEHRISYLMFILRGLGIPAYIDFCPQWGNRSNGHSWIAILEKHNKTMAYNLGEDSIMPTKNEVPFAVETGRKVPKIYRRMWSTQRKAFPHQRSAEIMGRFDIYSSRLKDVTELYVPVSNLEFHVPKAYAENEIAYICVFDNEKWTPVDWSYIRNGKVVFKNMGRDIVYVVMTNNFGLKTLTKAFLLNTEGEIQFFNCDTKHTQNLELKRKYPMFPRIVMFYESMIGGRFEVANKADFSDAKLIYSIKQIPTDGFKEVNVKNLGAFKYLRYKGGKKSHCNIAELKIYNQDKLLTGTAIASTKELEAVAKKLFDDDILTFFDSRNDDDNDWVGIEFEKAQSISKLSYVPRNDANYIYEDSYNTYYWNNEWIPIGNVKVKNSLIIKNAPTNALMFVSTDRNDVNKRWVGKEQRIFSEGSGEVKWW